MSEQNKITKVFVLQNKQGLHVRPAALLAKTVSRYDAQVTVEVGDISVSGKSIMGLMSLAAPYGAKLKITAIGKEAEEVMKEIEELIERKFDEE